jgi:hypothetical protein
MRLGRSIEAHAVRAVAVRTRGRAEETPSTPKASRRAKSAWAPGAEGNGYVR